MTTLIQKFLQRPGEAWSPDDLDQLAQVVANERSQLQGLVAEVEVKVDSIQQARDHLEGILQEVVSRSQEAEGGLAELRSRSEGLRDAAANVSGLNERLDHYEIQFSSLVSEQKNLNGSTRQLEERLHNLQDAGSGLLADFDQAKTMAASLDEVLSGLSAGRELARKNDEQLRNLHALWEHINQKMISLEGAKQLIERVDSQTRQVEEAVWNIEEKVNHFSEESRLIQSSEENVKLLQELLGGLSQDLERASEERENLNRRSGDLFGEVNSALQDLREQLNRSEILREDIDMANGRIEALFRQLRDQEDLAKGVEARGEELIAASLETKELIGKAAALSARFDALEERIQKAEHLETRLGALGEMSRKVDSQIDSIDERQTLVEATDQRLSQMSGVFSEVKERLASLQSQRHELDQTLQLFGDFRGMSVEIRGRIKELDGEFERVDEVERRLEELRRLLETLEGTVVDLEPRIEFVEGVESRLNQLDALSQRVDARIESQLASQSDLDSMRHSQEGISQQLDDLKKLASALQSSPKLSAMDQRLSEFEDRLQVTCRRLERVETLERSLVENEQHLESVAQALHESQGTLDSHAARLEALSDQSTEAKEIFGGWMDGVTRLEARQRELREQAEVTDSRLREAQGLHNKLEEDIDVLAEREKQLERHAQEMQTLDGLLRDLDRKVDAVNSRHAIVDRVKKDVQKVFDTIDQSRQQALQVLTARQEIAEVGEKAAEVGSRVHEMENRIDGVHRQLGIVETAEVKIDALNNIVNDIDVNLEHFEGQKAMVEHLAEKIATLDVLVKHAEATARELREERQLAFRIQKTVRPFRDTEVESPVALTVVENEEPVEADPEREASQPA